MSAHVEQSTGASQPKGGDVKVGDSEYEFIKFDPTIERAVGHSLTRAEYIPLALSKRLGQAFVYFSEYSIGLEGAPSIEMTDDFRDAIRSSARNIHQFGPDKR